MYIDAQQWSNRSASSIRFCSWQLCPWSRSKTITVLGKFDSVLKGFVSPNIAVVKLWSHHCTFCLLKLLRFHSTRYATQYNYYRIQARTNYSKFSFKFFTSKLWESIPVSLKLLPPNSFRAHYKLYLLCKQQRNDRTVKITWEPDLPILFCHYSNQLKSLSSSGCCALIDNVSLLV